MNGKTLWEMSIFVAHRCRKDPPALTKGAHLTVYLLNLESNKHTYVASHFTRLGGTYHELPGGPSWDRDILRLAVSVLLIEVMQQLYRRLSSFSGFQKKSWNF
jgi:hypothetical protein